MFSFLKKGELKVEAKNAYFLLFVKNLTPSDNYSSQFGKKPCKKYLRSFVSPFFFCQYNESFYKNGYGHFFSLTKKISTACQTVKKKFLQLTRGDINRYWKTWRMVRYRSCNSCLSKRSSVLENADFLLEKETSCSK